MSFHKQSPAFFRYLKARLQPLGRPAFWASSVGMLLVLLFVAKYWNDPEWLSRLGGGDAATPEEVAANANLSPEELAAIADIDSSSILLEQFDPAAALQVEPLPELDSENSQDSDPSQAPEGLLAEFSLGKFDSNSLLGSNPSPNNSANTEQQSSNPFATSVQNFLMAGARLGGGTSNNQNPSSLATALLANGGILDPTSSTRPNAANTNSSTANGNSSVEANTSASNPSSSGGQSPTRTLSQTSPTLNSPGQFSTPNPSTNFSGGSPYNAAGQPNYYPTYPAPGTTNYGTPPTTTAPQNSYQYLVPPPAATGVPAPVPVTPGSFGQTQTQPSGQAGGFNNPNVTPPVGTSQIQPSQVIQPSPSPQRQRPLGQFGGGQINTFSNP